MAQQQPDLSSTDLLALERHARYLAANIVGDVQAELLDPEPDVSALLRFYDRVFFGGLLNNAGIAVSWSPRMTLCAGLCRWRGVEQIRDDDDDDDACGGGAAPAMKRRRTETKSLSESQGGRLRCDIRLSAPLLRLRPRTDLLDTLLHEAIHAYEFVAGGIMDHDGHGPTFLQHAARMNQHGFHITVYHSFHQEVDAMRTHHWQCTTCSHVLKRAMNRAPGPTDRWWAGHSKRCGGTYVKIAAPEVATVSGTVKSAGRKRNLSAKSSDTTNSKRDDSSSASQRTLDSFVRSSSSSNRDDTVGDDPKTSVPSNSDTIDLT